VHTQGSVRGNAAKMRDAIRRVIIRIREWREKIRLYNEISGVGEIARRYFALNAFDGTLTIFGVVLGIILAKGPVPDIYTLKILIGAGIGGSIAMCISGIFGAYVTEKAERERKLRELESAMLAKLEDTIISRANRFATVMIALIDGFAPLLTALLSLIPPWLSLHGILPLEYTIPTTIVAIFAILFMLGVFLGRATKEPAFIYGLKTLAIGMATSLLLIALDILI